MRITEIHLKGEGDRFAVIKRLPGAGFARGTIQAQLITAAEPNGGEPITAMIDDEQQLWAMASRLQHGLDGRIGCGGDVRDYFTLLQRIA